uniref:Uncharacterized protein n=1 Tax=Mycena chlorophos TaxID=658473 RepID=A0ABQ0MD96_MYCCL|nr:predicted protein [Mycena chlorophos]
MNFEHAGRAERMTQFTDSAHASPPFEWNVDDEVGFVAARTAGGDQLIVLRHTGVGTDEYSWIVRRRRGEAQNPLSPVFRVQPVLVDLAR